MFGFLFRERVLVCRDVRRVKQVHKLSVLISMQK